MGDVKVELSDGEVFAIGAGVVGLLSIFGYAAYRAGRAKERCEWTPALCGEWPPEGEYVFPVALRDPTPTRAIRLSQPVQEFAAYELPEELFTSRIDLILDALEQQVLASADAPRLMHPFGMEDRKALERVASEGDPAQRLRAERLLVLHDVSHGNAPPEDGEAAFWEIAERRGGGSRGGFNAVRGRRPALRPLTDADPEGRWAAEAKRLGISVKDLREQIRLADEVMEEILEEGRRTGRQGIEAVSTVANRRFGKINALRSAPRNPQGLTFQEWAARAGWSDAAKRLTGQGYEEPEIQWQMGEDPEEVRGENVGAGVSLAQTLGMAYPHAGGVNALNAARKATSKEVEAAVRATQLLMGIRQGGTACIRDEQKLYSRMQKAIEKVAKKHNAEYVDVAVQIEAEAKNRGAIIPTPGKDI